MQRITLLVASCATHRSQSVPRRMPKRRQHAAKQLHRCARRAGALRRARRAACCASRLRTRDPARTGAGASVSAAQHAGRVHYCTCCRALSAQATARCARDLQPLGATRTGADGQGATRSSGCHARRRDCGAACKVRAHTARRVKGGITHGHVRARSAHRAAHTDREAVQDASGEGQRPAGRGLGSRSNGALSPRRATRIMRAEHGRSLSPAGAKHPRGDK